MAPRLRVLAGTSPETMVPITSLVNTSSSYTLSSPLFEGKVNVQIKGMTDEKGRVRDSKYFNREDKVGITWSIQVQGRFLVPQSADDILFGNTFDRPLKLPWGTSAVLKFMHYIDPTLEHDLASSSKPWALSPMISTMPHFMHTRLTPKSASSCKPSLTKAPSFPSLHSVKDDTNQLYVALVDLDEGGLPLHPPSISSSTSSFAPSSFAPSSSPASTSLSSTSPRTSPDLRLSIPHRSPSSLSSHSAGSSASSASFASALSLVSSSSSSSSSGSVPSAPGSSGSKLSGGGSIHIKQAMRKVHLRKRSASRGRSDREEEEEDGEQRRKAMRKEREKELRKLDSSSAAQRRAHFASRAKRRDIWFGPDDIITTDFCYGFINFAPSLSLQLPGGLSFDLMKYWDGQPVRFVCCERVKVTAGAPTGQGNINSNSQSGEPWGRIFWCVAIEIVEEEEEEDEDRESAEIARGSGVN